MSSILKHFEFETVEFVIYWMNQQMDQLLKQSLNEKQQLAQGKIAKSAQQDAVKRQVSEDVVNGRDRNGFDPAMVPMGDALVEMEDVEQDMDVGQQPGHSEGGDQSWGDDTF